MNIQFLRQRLFLCLLAWVSLGLVGWVSDVSAENGTNAGASALACPGNARINEIDYAMPGVDNQEFVEIQGDIGTDLTGYEVRFVDGASGSALTYRSVSLDGVTIGLFGYVVVGNSALPVDDAVLVPLDGSELVQNGAPDGVGIFSALSTTPCDFINYEGTVSGLADFLQIGTDDEDDGLGRGCSRREFGAWSCDRDVTPGSDNAPLAVTTASVVPVSDNLPLAAAAVVVAFILLGMATIGRTSRASARQ